MHSEPCVFCEIPALHWALISCVFLREAAFCLLAALPDPHCLISLKLAYHLLSSPMHMACTAGKPQFPKGKQCLLFQTYFRYSCCCSVTKNKSGYPCHIVKYSQARKKVCQMTLNCLVLRAHVHNVNVHLSLIRAPWCHPPLASIELYFFFCKWRWSKQDKIRVVRDVPVKLARCDAFRLWKYKYRNIAISCGLSNMTASCG